MAITTYNNAPYFDDFNIKDANGQTVGDKNYLKILFQPGQGVQTRELNQMQSILQAQIDRFGKSFYKDGQAVLDAKTNFIEDVIYIDITPESPFTGESLATSLSLQPDVEVRLRADDLNLQTTSGGSYVKVLGADVKSNELVRLYVEAIAEVADNPNVPLSTKIPTGAELFYKDGVQITSVQGGVTNTQSNIGNFGTVAAAGHAFGGTIEEGIFFVKGHFVHTPAIYRYWIKSTKDQIVRGDLNLIVNEKIITSNDDLTLLDNASGSYNYSAPGGDRYQITLDVGFFEPVALFKNILGQNAGIYIQDTAQTFDIKRLLGINEAGVDIERNAETAELNRKLADRTKDESGNYTVNPFRLDIRELVDVSNNAGVVNDPIYTSAEINDLSPFGIQSAADGAKKFAMQITGSTAYVDGFRFTYPYKTTLIADKARTTTVLTDVDTSLAIGNYIEVDLHNSPGGTPVANFSPYATKAAITVRNNINDKLFASQGAGGTAFPVGNSVIRSAQFVSDDSTSPSTYRWRFYLSNGVTLSEVNEALPNLKSTFVNASKRTTSYSAHPNYLVFGSRNTSTTTGASSLGRSDANLSGNVFKLPPGDGVQRVTSVTYEIFKKFTGTYSKASHSDGSGRSIISLSGLSTGESFIGTTGTDKFDYTIIHRTGSASPYNYRLVNPENYEIISGSDASAVQIGQISGQASPLFNYSPPGVPEAPAQYIVYAPVRKSVGIDGSRQKVLKAGQTDIVSQLAGGTTGTKGDIIVLGDQDIDVTSIENTELGSNFSVIDNGLNNPEFYGEVKIQLTGDVVFTQDGNGQVLITYSFYEHKSGGDFFTVNSYGDYTQDSPGLIGYDDIPEFGGASLADYIDFRVKQNNLSPRIGSEYGPVRLIPNRNITVTLSHYLPRKDRIILDNQGIIRVIQGVPDLDPAVPELPSGSMTLYSTFVPAYTGATNRIKAHYVDNSRFTMRDIGRLKKRIDQVEYYSSLSLLESDAFNKNILNPDGTQKFKNGFLVSNFKKDIIADPGAPGYLAGIDFKAGILQPFQRNTNFRLFYQYPKGDTGTNSYDNSLATVDDYYINNTPNRYSYNTVTNQSIPTTGRPGMIILKNFRIGSAPDIDTNGTYVLAIGQNTYGNPTYVQYKQGSDGRLINPPVRRVVRKPVTFPSDLPQSGLARALAISALPQRWEVQRLNADGTFAMIYKTTSAGATGNDAPFPTSVTAGAWSNQSNQSQNVSTTGADAVAIDISRDVIDDYLPESTTASERDKQVITGFNNPTTASLWKGMANGREVFAQNLSASRTVSIQPYEVAVYKGKLKTSPDNDLWIDQVNKPARVIQDDSLMITMELLQEHTDLFGGPDGVVPGIWENNGPVGTTLIDTNTTRQGRTTTQTRTFEDTVEQVRENIVTEISSSESITQDLGERVVDINIVPHVRSRDIALYASGMKPNTQVYIFLDGRDVTRYCAPTEKFIEYGLQESVTTYDNEGAPDSRNEGGVFRSEEANHYDLPLFTTAETGEFFGTLRIPNNTDIKFRCGTLSLKITSSPLNNDDEADTFAEKLYQAFAIKQDVEQSIISTKIPEIETTRVEETRTLVTQRQAVRRWRVDPVAQTFEVDKDVYPHGISLTDVDLYFAEKPSYIADVECYITTTEGGRPTQTIIPGSKVNKPYHQVNVSANGRNETDGNVILNNVTNFVFDFPIYLKPGNNYALVVRSKSVDYRLWAAEIGGSNLINAGLPITANAFKGVLCKSANNLTWTADQTKDLMFRLNKGKFETEGTFVFHTKASGVYGSTSQQKIGQPQSSTAANIILSGIFLQVEDVVIPGTSLKYSIDFQGSDGLLARDAYGIPQAFDSTQTILFKQEIDTVARGVDNIILTAQMSIPTSMQKVDAQGEVYSDVSPIIDLDTMNLLGVQNIVNESAYNKTLQTPFPSIQDARNTQRGFVTKKVPLSNPADNLRIFLLTNRISKDAGLEVYVKAKGIADSGEFKDFDWSPASVRSLEGAEVKALGTSSPSLQVNPNLDIFTDAEYYYSPRPGNNISEYAVKIAFTGNDSSKIVRVKDFRSIATS